MDLNIAKWVVLLSLLLLTLFFCLLPLWLLWWSARHIFDRTQQARFARVISLVSCFAGGVFMATGLLHLFPEVNEALDHASLNSGFPFGGFLVALGFFIILCIEQIVLDHKERSEIQMLNQRIEHADTEDDQVRRRTGSMVGVTDHPLTSSTDGNTLDPADAADPHSTFRSLMLTAALSLHSVFEGLVIGLQPDVDTVMQFFLAVGLHKIAIALGLGLNLAQSKLSLWAIIRSDIVFSIASPIGLAIGICIEDFGKSIHESAVNFVLQGLACGTFFYVTFFEVLPYELNKGGDRLLKLMAVLFGFSMICGVMFLDPDSATSGGSCPPA